MREKQFENQVKGWLESQGVYRIGTDIHASGLPTAKGWWVKRWGGGEFIPAGMPDMQIVIGCFEVDVELKNENGKLDPLQIQKLRQINQAGGYAIVLRPQYFDDFKAFITDLIRRVDELRATGEIWGCDIGAGEF